MKNLFRNSSKDFLADPPRILQGISSKIPQGILPMISPGLIQEYLPGLFEILWRMSSEFLQNCFKKFLKQFIERFFHKFPLEIPPSGILTIISSLTSLRVPSRGIPGTYSIYFLKSFVVFLWNSIKEFFPSEFLRKAPNKFPIPSGFFPWFL